jgi:glycosyltransferase involved in cell wall biosynthesis
MRVAALMMVRNEADIVAVNVRYHRSVGITDFFVIDNGSVDSTPQVLAELAREIPGVRWTRDTGSFHQALITTGLAQEAHAAGVDWVVPIDADEFWYPGTSGFSGVLASCDAPALEVDLATFVQRRDVEALHEHSLTTMTGRIQVPHPYEGARNAVETGVIAYVEMAYPSKWISRASATLAIHSGNHAVDGIDGLRSTTDAIVCFHAPLRARAVLPAKAGYGRRLRELGVDAESGWHLQRWADLETSGGLDDDWSANSWRLVGADAVIDPPRGAKPIVFDPRLRDLVQPFLPRPGVRSR